MTRLEILLEFLYSIKEITEEEKLELEIDFKEEENESKISLGISSFTILTDEELEEFKYSYFLYRWEKFIKHSKKFKDIIDCLYSDNIIDSYLDHFALNELHKYKYLGKHGDYHLLMH